MNPEDIGTDLQERMATIRAKRIHLVAELQTEAGRLTDWREHVKSAPLAALAGSAILGFVTVKSLSGTPKTTVPVYKSSSYQPERQARPSLFGGVAKMAMAFAFTMGKSYVTRQFHTFANKVTNEKFSPSSTSENKWPDYKSSHHG